MISYIHIHYILNALINSKDIYPPPALNKDINRHIQNNNGLIYIHLTDSHVTLRCVNSVHLFSIEDTILLY